MSDGPIWWATNIDGTGVVQCERLDEILDRRRRVALMYIERLMTSKFVILPTLISPVLTQYVRDGLDRNHACR